MSSWRPIPGETPIDPSGLKVKGVTTRSQLNILEAEGIRKVVVKYLAGKINRRTAPFDYSWCLRLHKEMFGDVWEWAGLPRSKDGYNLGIPAHCISSTLFALIDDLNSWPNFGMDWSEQAARLHHRAVQIHPFPNGNGRWARMLANIWLKLNAHGITVWPEQTIGDSSEIRDEYLAAIQAADNGDYEPLIGLHRRYTAIE